MGKKSAKVALKNKRKQEEAKKVEIKSTRSAVKKKAEQAKVKKPLDIPLMEYMAQPSAKCTLAKINTIRENFDKSPERKRLFMETCFAPLYNLPSMKFISQVAHHLVQRHLGNFEFDIQGTVLKFTELDFALIMGLRSSPSTVSQIKPNVTKDSLRVRRFPNLKKITKNQLILEFEECEDHIDAVKLALVIFVETLLIGSETNTCINIDYLYLINNIEDFNKYPWGTVGYNCLKKVMNIAIKGGNRPSKYNIYGCVFALQIWAYERMPELARLCATKEAIQIPRILSWHTAHYFGYRKLVKEVFEKQNVILLNQLQPTEEEEHSLHVTDVLKRLGIETGGRATVGRAEGKGNEEDVKNTTSPHSLKRRKIVSEELKKNDLMAMIDSTIQKAIEDMSQHFKAEIAGVNMKIDMLSCDLKALKETWIMDREPGQKEEAKLTEMMDEELNKEEETPMRGPYVQREEGHSDILSPRAESCSLRPQRKQILSRYLKSPYTQAMRKTLSNYTAPAPGEHVNVLIDPKRPLTAAEAKLLTTFISKGKTKEKNRTNEYYDEVGGVQIRPSWLDVVYKPTGWLDSDHMDVYMELLARRHTQYPIHYTQLCTFAPTWFMQMLLSSLSNFEEYRRVSSERERTEIAKRINDSIRRAAAGHIGKLPMWECERVYIPFNVHGNHWVLAIVEPPNREIFIMDSIHNSIEESYPGHIKALVEGLPALFHIVGDNDAFEGEAWTVTEVQDIPKQETIHDCEIFVLKYVDYLCSDLTTIDFTQVDILKFRRRIAFEIMTCAATP